MSNFGKIKNIWNLDVVSKEEMKTILQEWDDALTTLQNDLNEVKRLTKLKQWDTPNSYDGSVSFNKNYYGDVDFTRPIYIEFETFFNPSRTKYNYVVILTNGANYTYLNEYVSIKITDINMSKIYFYISNLPSGGRIEKFKLRFTPKTLTTTINETQEEGE